MENSIKDIINGIYPFTNFEKVIVEKCTYVNREEEKTEKLPIWDEATATLICNGRNFQFSVFDSLFGMNVPFANFIVNAQFFYRQESFGEMAQVNLCRGNEIQMLRPLVTPGYIDDNCRITLFNISRQNGKLIVCLLLTPESTDDYYYRVIFKE